MPTACQDLIESYLEWLRTKISVKEINGACEITTPFLDRHNDRIQIFAVPIENGFRLTDDGYVIGDLESSGCSFNTPNRLSVFKTILTGFGVHEDEGELFVETSVESFPQKKHALIQAMLAVNDMFMMSRQHVATLFLEDVSRFLDDHEVRYSQNVEFTGKTGFIHKFDFLIPKSKQYPERLLRTINNPTRDKATSVLFSWTDTKGVRSPNSRCYVFLNDEERQPSADLVAAFKEYDVHTIKWSERNQHVEELAA
jgi:Domain of unknown function DUF1829/Domain of unknown function DUF1828